jgi:signal recognition particle subunit SRP54
MDELRAMRAELDPAEVLLVADAMTARRVAHRQDFTQRGDWLILTKLDGDARGGRLFRCAGDRRPNPLGGRG